MVEETVPSKIAQIWLMSSRIVNKKVIWNLNSNETFYNWLHFKVALIFYLKYCLSYLKTMLYLLAWTFLVFKPSNILTCIGENGVPLGFSQTFIYGPSESYVI